MDRAATYGLLAIAACATPTEPVPTSPPTRAPIAAAPFDTGGPAVIASGQAPGDLVVAGGWLYWIDIDRAIRRVSLGGGPPATVTALEPGDANGLAVDGDTVYFTSADRVMKVPARGGVAIPLATEQERPGPIAVRGAEVFWANLPKVLHGPQRGQIAKMPAAGGPVTTLVAGQQLEGGFVVERASVYFSTVRAVMRVPTAGGRPSQLGVGAKPPDATFTAPEAIASDGTSLFWIQRLIDDHGLMDATDLWKAPLAGGDPVHVARIPGGAIELAVDDSAVYLATVEVGSGGDHGALLRVAKDGGASSVVAKIANISALAVDAASVFVATNPGGYRGTVVRIAK